MRNIFIRRLIEGLVFVLLIVATSAVLLIILTTNPSSYLAAILDKHELLKSTQGPRVIVVGGSSVAFGLDSELLARLLHKPVVNNGLHAGLGERFILNDLSAFLHPGDIVVLTPEYETFFKNTSEALEGNDQTLALLLEVYPQAVQSFETSQYFRLLDIYILMLRSRLQRLANLLIYKENPFYSRASFNSHGDFIAHLGKQSVSKIDGSAYINKSEYYNPAAIHVFNRFARQIKEKGVTVIMVYPPSRMTNVIASKGRLRHLDNYLRVNLDLPVISHPRNCCFEDTLFFNSQYHLNTEGRHLRTLRLAELLINKRIIIND